MFDNQHLSLEGKIAEHFKAAGWVLSDVMEIADRDLVVQDIHTGMVQAVYPASNQPAFFVGTFRKGGPA